MKTTKKMVLWILVLAIPVVGCKNTSTGRGVSGADTKAVVRGNTAFAVDLYHQLCSSEGNFFFSPYGISTDLALIYAGARGSTEDETAKVLHFSLPQDRLHAALGELQARLNRMREARQITLSVANSLWAQRDAKFRDDYLSLIDRYYGVSVFPVDFGDARQVSERINRWVGDKTGHKINSLMAPGTLDNLTSLVSISAVYFKGTWRHQFDPRNTENRPFYVTTERSVQTPMMFRTGKSDMHRLTGCRFSNCRMQVGSSQCLSSFPAKKTA